MMTNEFLTACRELVAAEAAHDETQAKYRHAKEKIVEVLDTPEEDAHMEAYWDLHDMIPVVREGREAARERVLALARKLGAGELSDATDGEGRAP